MFIPGALPAESRKLLVSHADTVWGDEPPSVEWLGSLLVSRSGLDGFGADDRFGCAMIWALSEQARKEKRPYEHSILITTGEEVGGIGAIDACIDMWKDLSAHCYAIQIDRRGDKEMALYDEAYSKAFVDYIVSVFPDDWSLTRGTFTDISEICPGVGISGINVSAGYIHEHTRYETGLLDVWLRTKETLEYALNQDPRRRFSVNRTPVVKYTPLNRVKWDEIIAKYVNKVPQPKASPIVRETPFWDIIDGTGRVVGKIDKEENPQLRLLETYDGFLRLEDISKYELVDIKGNPIS